MKDKKKNKWLIMLLSVILIVSMSGCEYDENSDKKDSNSVKVSSDGKVSVSIDYGDAESFESALNDGEDLEDKVVQFEVREIKPDSVLGFNVWAGEHLNFVSDEDPDFGEGDTVVVKIVSYKNVLKSWIIEYEIVDNAFVDDNTITKDGKTDNETENDKATEEVKVSAETPTEKETEETTEKPEGEFKYKVTDAKFKYFKDSFGGYDYFGYVEIKNTGTTNIYMDDCTFDLEDNDGHLLQTENWVSKTVDIVAPGEKAYFYINSGSIDDGVDLSNGINLVPQYTVAEAEGEIVDYKVSDTDIRAYRSYGGVKVTGRVKNTTEEDESLLDVIVIYYDSNNDPIGFDSAYVSVDAGRKASFEITTWESDDRITMDTVAKYKVIARKGYYQW